MNSLLLILINFNPQAQALKHLCRQQIMLAHSLADCPSNLSSYAGMGNSKAVSKKTKGEIAKIKDKLSGEDVNCCTRGRTRNGVAKLRVPYG